MKKIKIILVLLCAALLTTALSSCKSQTIFHRICGYYIELVDVDEYSVDDKNPKVYFKYLNNDIFSTNTGNPGKVVSFQNSAKTVNKDTEVIKHFFSTDLVVPASSFEKIPVHLIILKEGKNVVETEIFKTINKTGSCRCAYKYTYLGQKYEIEFDLEIKERG